jgi:methylmalonyl-CoA mutase cobalamin-binding subunit
MVDQQGVVRTPGAHVSHAALQVKTIDVVCAATGRRQHVLQSAAHTLYGQGVQKRMPRIGAKVPAAQGVQAAEALDEYWPAAHERQACREEG